MVFVILIFFLILSYAVSSRLKRKLRRYSQTLSSSQLTGQEVAEKMLQAHRITDVSVTCTRGKLTDHYNPVNKTVNLSEEVFHGRSIASAAVASHECGHAVQHANAYGMLQLRTALVPLQNLSARIMNFIFIMMFFGGFVFQGIFPLHTALLVIVICYGIFTVFSLVTLPVEFDASKRALVWIGRNNIVSASEQRMASDALQAAAMTYVVAALGSLAMLLYYVMLLLGGSRD